ncbi:class I SAM-dependent methyltransferase [Reichenbachiella agarivorans]|uniref:Class I SAM-dependent methyltransferase n=1 Tax=Reichenbachiella agarivorans TaxID=2979464 RepID=A0ABY6CNA0_9BACT|nr:class I SAM-dependent methyltransferase [Reichenbachiella agarivorans]UXP31962.1 class I SAM-dependent methyltransferase [Reichenbachiella agarivorans]
MIGLSKKLLSFNSSRYRLLDENRKFAQTIPSGAVVLDAGAGDQIYRSLLQHTQYESADFEKVDKEYAQSTYVCDLKEIPVENNRFDYILFNQVMEHLPEPNLVLTELNRVLKPDGKIIYTGPLFYEEHEIPYDFFRYTQFSLRKMFSDAGFEIERLDWMEGYFGTVGYQLNRMAQYLPTNPKDLGGGLMGYLLCPMMLLLKIFSALTSIFFHKLEVKNKYTKKGYPKNYVGIFRKSTVSTGA